ncbi:MAG: hypothetical protein IT269_03015 [Saprospiraceae bacterium]|nr:hypothetical protein [Saprospiraceae bacterium]
MPRPVLALALLFFTLVSAAQRLDRHALIMLSMTRGSDARWSVSKIPKYLSTFNVGGYNNQPSFFSDNELYITAQLYGDTNQTDIVALDLVRRTIDRVTATTRTAEYSPTLMPGGERFSAVRVEENGQQRLWSFPMDRSDYGQPVLPKIYGVGYHCWLRDTLLALFIVGEETQPHYLVSTGLKEQRTKTIASDPGRCLLRLPDGQLAFVQKATKQTWYLKTWNPDTGVQNIITKMPPGIEDFARLPDGSFICGQGSKLMLYTPGSSTDWEALYDYSRFNVTNISRLAVNSEGRLILVVR